VLSAGFGVCSPAATQIVWLTAFTNVTWRAPLAATFRVVALGAGFRETEGEAVGTAARLADGWVDGTTDSVREGTATPASGRWAASRTCCTPRPPNTATEVPATIAISASTIRTTTDFTTAASAGAVSDLVRSDYQETARRGADNRKAAPDGAASCRVSPSPAGVGCGSYFQVSLRVRVQPLPVLMTRLPPDSQVTAEPFFFTYLYSTLVLAGRLTVPFQTG
jgi:hypothetical protein